jgi:hypothetical protein
MTSCLWFLEVSAKFRCFCPKQRIIECTVYEKDKRFSSLIKLVKDSTLVCQLISQVFYKSVCAKHHPIYKLACIKILHYGIRSDSAVTYESRGCRNFTHDFMISVYYRHLEHNIRSCTVPVNTRYIFRGWIFSWTMACVLCLQVW